MDLSLLICDVDLRATIVGVDPGTTSGWAVLDLEGEVIATGSSRSLGTDALLDRVLVHGSPVVVATDVSPPPEAVEKVARAVDAELWCPERSLKVREKLELTGEFEVENDHEGDALASALKAYAAHRNLLERIETKTPSGIDTEEVKRSVIRGTPIADAVRDLREPEEEPAEEPDRKVERETLLTRQARSIERLRDREEELESELERLEGEIAVLRAENERLKAEARSGAVDEETVEELREEVSGLEERLDRERRRSSRLNKALNEARRGDTIERRDEGRVAFILEDLTRDEVEQVASTFDLRGRPVYVESGGGAGRSGIEVLAENGAEAVIIGDDLPHHADEALFENEIPCLDEGGMDLRFRESFVVIDEGDYESGLERGRKALEERRERELESLLERFTEEPG